MKRKFFVTAYTFDDLLLVPNYSSILPKDTSLKTKLTKRISLNIPIISAAMDTVTSYEMAKTMTLLGGVGVIHKNMSVDEQSNIVKQLKNYVVDTEKYPNVCLTTDNKLLTAAGIGVSSDVNERVSALVDAGVDVLFIDSAHGHTFNVIELLKKIKSTYPHIDVVAVNIATGVAAEQLIEAGADAIKVGIGPGSICTTRVVSGIGVPQMTAIFDCYEVASKYNVPIIADGGIRYSGDMVKALAGGADVVMVGSLLAGTDEAPGEKIIINNKEYKQYRGMGSLSAMQKGSADRYFQSNNQKFVPEGIESLIPYRGKTEDIVYQMTGGIRSGLAYCGSVDLKMLKEKANFIVQTVNGLKEAHPHDLEIIKESPNYSK